MISSMIAIGIVLSFARETGKQSREDANDDGSRA
jgi:hypothetical protein